MALATEDWACTSIMYLLVCCCCHFLRARFDCRRCSVHTEVGTFAAAAYPTSGQQCRRYIGFRIFARFSLVFIGASCYRRQSIASVWPVYNNCTRYRRVGLLCCNGFTIPADYSAAFLCRDCDRNSHAKPPVHASSSDGTYSSVGKSHLSRCPLPRLAAPWYAGCFSSRAEQAPVPRGAEYSEAE